MATLTERLDARITALTAERARIEAQHAQNLSEVDGRLEILAAAKKAVTKEIEGAYVALVAAGLIQEVTERG